MAVNEEDIRRAVETLEADRVPSLVEAAKILQQTWREFTQMEHQIGLLRCALKRKLKWEGGFAEAKRMADEIVGAHLYEPRVLIEIIAIALVEAFDNGVLAESCENWTPKSKQAILTKLLREHGIGVATMDKLTARTTAIAKGELKPSPDEPKLWFTSIEAMVACLKRAHVDTSSESC